MCTPRGERFLLRDTTMTMANFVVTGAQLAARKFPSWPLTSRITGVHHLGSRRSPGEPSDSTEHDTTLSEGNSLETKDAGNRVKVNQISGKIGALSVKA